MKKKPQAAWWPFIPVALLAFIIYSSTLNAGFVWDDHNLVEALPDKQGISDFARPWYSDFWQTGEIKSRSEYYRPLTTTTFMIDKAVYKNSPAGYHLTNIFIYVLVCCLAYLLFARFLQSAEMPLFLALFFTALPAHTENVAWISGRTDLLCALFMLPALLFYLKADENDNRLVLALSVVFYALSLFSKEMSITLVAVVALHQLIYRGLEWKAVMRTLPFAVTAVAFAILHVIAAPHVQEENIYTTAGQYLVNVLRNLSIGVVYSVFPGGLELLVTGTREEAGRLFQLPGVGGVLLHLLVVVLVVGGAAISWIKKEKALAFCLCSAFVALLPVVGIVPIGAVFAVRFLLIPSLFFTLAAGILLSRLDSLRLHIRGIKLSLPVMILFLAMASYSVLSAVQASRWKSDETIMRWVLEKAPTASLGHFILGNALAGQDEAEQAIEHYKRAIKIRPDYPKARFNLGLMYQKQGKNEKALEAFQRSLEQKPSFQPARQAQYWLLMSMGRKEQARELMSSKSRQGR